MLKKLLSVTHITFYDSMKHEQHKEYKMNKKW